MEVLGNSQMNSATAKRAYQNVLVILLYLGILYALYSVRRHYAPKELSPRDAVCLEACYPYQGKPFGATLCTCDLDHEQDDSEEQQ